MALDEMVMLMEEDGTFRTGKEWPGVWTRDVSYAAPYSHWSTLIRNDASTA
jgi:hypothetical protein